MKPLVVFYTRFGHNLTIAETVAAELGADLRRITTPTQPSYPVMGACSFFNIPMRILPMDFDVSAYDPVVLCTPIWAWKPAPPAREFLKRANLGGKRLAVCFSTGGGPTMRAQEKVCQLIGHCRGKVFAFGEIPTRPEDRDRLVREAKTFAARLKT